MMREIQPFRVMFIHQQQSGASEHVQDFDKDRTCQDERRLATPTGRKTYDQSGIQDDHFQSVTGIRYEQHPLLPAQDRDDVLLFSIPFDIYVRPGGIISRPAEKIQGPGSAYTECISDRPVQNPVWDKND